MSGAEHERPADAGGTEVSEDAAEERSAWWWYLLGAGVAVAVAVACFTPLWHEVAGSSSGRRAGFVALLQTLGPGGVAAIAVVVAAGLVVWALRERAKDRAGR